MSRSSILAAAIMTLGLAAFVLLVSGGAFLPLSHAPVSPEDEALATAETEATERVVVEPGVWIAYEEATYVSH